MPILGWTNIGTAVLLALSIAWGFYERSGWSGCVASIATEAAKAAQKVADEKAADARTTRILETHTRVLTDQIQESANATRTSLARVVSDPNCARTPAAAAFDAGVQPARPAPAPGAARPAGP